VKYVKPLNEAEKKEVPKKEVVFKFQNVEEGLPQKDRPVLMKYIKGKKGAWRGQKGEFYTQGFYHEEDHGHRYERTWYDYTDRQIQDLDASTSKNTVLEWAYIDE